MNQILYNCHTEGSAFRITKFNDGEVESSYLCSLEACECPAGHRPSCRHRHMLPRFLAKGAVNTFYFYDYDRQGWVTNEPARSHISGDPVDDLPTEPELVERSSLSVPNERAEDWARHETEIEPTPSATLEPPLRRRI